MSAPSTNRPRPDRGQKGAALVLVLLLIALFAGIVADFLYTIRINTYLARNKTDQVRGKFVAEAGITAAKGILTHSSPFSRNGRGIFQNDYFSLYQCKCYTSSQASSLQAGTQMELEAQAQEEGSTAQTAASDCGEWKLVIDYPMDEDTLHLEISDEQARLNLNALVKKGMNPEEQGTSVNEAFKPIVAELLKYRLREIGRDVSDNEITGLVDLIVDWVDYGTAEGALDSDMNQSFVDGDNLYYNKNAAMDTVSELKMIPGVSDEVYYAVKDFFTVYPLNPETAAPLYKVNIDMANQAVLYALIRGASWQAQAPAVSEDEAIKYAQDIVQTGIETDGKLKTREIPAELRGKLNMGTFQLNPDLPQPRWYHLVSSAIAPSGVNYTIEAVVLVMPGTNKLRFLYWREG